MALTAYSEPTQLQPRPRPTLRRLDADADLACLMCGSTVGVLVGRTAYHHAGCSGRLRIERGMIRCCRCNGAVYKQPVGELTRR